MSNVEQVLHRLATDESFRARVTVDTGPALEEYHLTDAEQEQVLQHAEILEGRIEEEVAEQIDTEEGQADAAGAKG